MASVHTSTFLTFHSTFSRHSRPLILLTNVFFPTVNERRGGGEIHSALKASIYIHDEAHLICLFSLHAITSPLTALVP